MRKRNGRRTIGLATLSWLLTLGTIWAGDPAEPPAELFASPAEEGCADGNCLACQADGCESLACWLDSESSNLWSGAWGDWTIGAPIESGIELVWYLDSECPYVLNGGGFCPIASGPTWCIESGAFGCDSPGFLSRDTVPQQAPMMVELTANGEVDLKPGEPAEVLLEIRDRTGWMPLQGTLYQPIDAVSRSKAQNAFVEGVRASEELGVHDELCSETTAACLVQDSPPSKTAAVDRRGDAGERPTAGLVILLRDVSRELEQSANLLEECELYFRADQLREVATELRLEARSAGGSWSLEPLGAIPRTTAPEPQRDLLRENEELRAEIERLRHSLRASVPVDNVRTR